MKKHYQRQCSKIYLLLLSASSLLISKTIAVGGLPVKGTPADACPIENIVQVVGTTTISGEKYDATCYCKLPIVAQEVEEEVEPEPKAVCQPTQIKIKLEAEGSDGGACEKEIKDLIGCPSNLTFARIVENGFKTLDGRVNDDLLGTPGGDAGEFILAIQIYSEMMGASQYLTEEKVLNIFSDYLQYMKQGKFYMATDDKAIHHIEKQLNIIGLNITNPRPSFIKDIMPILHEPENIGDLHIKLLLDEACNYSVNKTLVEFFLRAFYSILWDNSDGSLKNKLNLDILAGEHREVAFVEIKTDIDCLRNNRAPLIPAHDRDGLQIFVNHIDAVNLLRADLSKFFTQHETHKGISGGQKNSDTETMFNRMNHLGLAWLELTGSYIAKYLPFYTVTLV